MKYRRALTFSDWLADSFTEYVSAVGYARIF